MLKNNTHICTHDTHVGSEPRRHFLYIIIRTHTIKISLKNDSYFKFRSYYLLFHIELKYSNLKNTFIRIFIFKRAFFFLNNLVYIFLKLCIRSYVIFILLYRFHKILIIIPVILSYNN